MSAYFWCSSLADLLSSVLGVLGRKAKTVRAVTRHPQVVVRPLSLPSDASLEPLSHSRLFFLARRKPTEGGVTVVVGNTFDKIVMDDSKHVLIELYAPWWVVLISSFWSLSFLIYYIYIIFPCKVFLLYYFRPLPSLHTCLSVRCTHCKNLVPIYSQLAKRAKNIPDLVIHRAFDLFHIVNLLRPFSSPSLLNSVNHTDLRLIRKVVAKIDAVANDVPKAYVPKRWSMERCRSFSIVPGWGCWGGKALGSHPPLLQLSLDHAGTQGAQARACGLWWGAHCWTVYQIYWEGDGIEGRAVEWANVSSLYSMGIGQSIVVYLGASLLTALFHLLHYNETNINFQAGWKNKGSSSRHWEEK